MTKVLPLTRNHKMYENIPDRLKWAVPIHEAISSPQAKLQAKLLEVLVDQTLAAEKNVKRSQIISLVPKLPIS